MTTKSHKRTLRAIFFDIDDTLYSTTEFAKQARKASIAAMRKHGFKMPLDHAIRELNEVISEFGANYDMHYEKLLRRVPERFKSGVNPAILMAAAVMAYHAYKVEALKPFDDAKEVFPVLAKADLHLGVITHGLDIKQAEKLLRLGLYEYFEPHSIFISEQVGISKPNEKLYIHALSALGLHPEEAMYVGDHPANDIDPPNRIGIHTVRMRRGVSRHDDEEGETKPNYEIKSYHELLDILRNDFDVKIDAPEKAAK
ncbi:MAG: TIGR02253 family HAD-type hydrolase [Planctomycetes bacterium]|nr:TIGR02253 family HAD-type hydrolase [Planctomycetota bacterium]